ncbi:AsmA family protein [Neisseria iguanae]|uniref:AsmA family protein n=1 Tax=Neisseria iguanae TaxID=90242 RepID=UPI001FEBD62A|nr:AsmA family protein [Neisseria iguanae]
MLNSGKFWLKIAFFGLLVSFLMFVSLYASVYHFLSAERIHQFTQENLGQTERTIRFDESIKRNLFPRPTITLKNLIISQPHSTAAAIHIKEMRIGLGWQSLWTDDPVIEKWVVSGANATLQRTSDGKWSLQDIWQQRRHTNFNRLIIENSTLRLRLISGEYLIEQLGLNTKESDSGKREFSVTGNFNSGRMPISWKGTGLLEAAANDWKIPAFRLTAESRLNDETIKVVADSALAWQTKQGLLQASKFTLRADSSYRSFHLTAQVPQLTFNTDHVYVDTFHSAFTAGNEADQWSGSLKLDKAKLLNGKASLAGFKLNANHRIGRLQTNISVSGPLVWQKADGLKSDAIHIASMQDMVNHALRPRYISLLDGSFSMTDWRHWQGKFNGYLDRQPAALTIKYSNEAGQVPLLEAGLALQKLSLSPYWEDLEAQSGNIYPEFLNDDNLPNIEAQVRIGNMSFPGLQLDNVETLISANRQHIVFTNFKAGLYGGHTEGSISMANTTPISYHFQQNVQSVQIRPLLQDLFGFHSFSGTGDTVINLTFKGQDRRRILQSLDGTLSLNVSDGAWHGIDINNILQNGNIKKDMENKLQTPFHRFSLNSVIEKGVSHHINTELLSDSVRVISSGFTNLEKQELSEELLIYNARNPDSRPVPLKIKGPVHNPSITLDYTQLTDGLETPQEKQQALENTLREQWNWLMPKRK